MYVHMDINFSDEDKSKSNIMVYSTILLGILTCGTAVLLWWLYKEYFSSKDKYDVEGTYVCTGGCT